MKIMKRIACILMGLMLLFPLPSCSSVGRTSYSDDYDVLWDALESSYPYLYYLRDELNVDLDNLRMRYDAEAASAENEEAFAQMLRKMLSELNNFGHLDLVTPEMYQSYCYVYSADGDPFAELLNDSRLSAIYVKPESREEHRQQTEKRLPEVFVQYFADGSALYLKISSFAQELVERDCNILRDALAQYPDTENVIIDITGNAGGSDYYWMQNLVAPLGGSYEFTFRSYYKTSELTNRYYGGCESAKLPADAPEWVESMGLDKCMENTMPVSTEGSEQSSVQIWVLTNENVFSASDKFACFCKSTGWATVVGTRTSGDGLGATPVMLLLPDSGLLIRFSALAGENPDGSMNAASGTLPDVQCPINQSALDCCLDLIRGN